MPTEPTTTEPPTEIDATNELENLRALRAATEPAPPEPPRIDDVRDPRPDAVIIAAAPPEAPPADQAPAHDLASVRAHMLEAFGAVDVDNEIANAPDRLRARAALAILERRGTPDAPHEADDVIANASPAEREEMAYGFRLARAMGGK